MKRFIFALAMVAVFATSAYAEEKTYPGPQEGAPNVYKQIFDNEKIRVSEITFKPGEKAAMHTHPYPHCVYIIEPGQLTLTYPDGTTKVLDGQAGQIMWMSAETHEAVNTGTTQVKALVTEVK